MKLTYSLNLNDFLQYQPYTASRNRIIKNQRLRGYIFFILFLITLSFISFSDYEKPAFFVTLLIAAVLLCIYPLYVRRYYYNHYKKSANENFKNKAEKEGNVSINDDYILLWDETGETKVYNSNLEGINEVNDYLYLKLKTGESIIFPKNKIENFDALQERLNALAEKYNLIQTKDLNWKWR